MSHFLECGAREFAREKVDANTWWLSYAKRIRSRDVPFTLYEVVLGGCMAEHSHAFDQGPTTRSIRFDQTRPFDVVKCNSENDVTAETVPVFFSRV